MTKESIRSEMSAAVTAMSTEERLVADAHVASAVTQLPEWKRAQSVFAYVAMDDEVDLAAIVSAALRSGKQIALPRIDDARHMRFCSVAPGERATWSDVLATLERHALGFLQPGPDSAPVEPQAGDLVLVPARAFDRRGYRVGRGGGYYDRFLATLAPAVFTVGISYTLQMMHKVPAGDDDMSVQIIVTDSETSFCRRT